MRHSIEPKQRRQWLRQLSPVACLSLLVGTWQPVAAQHDKGYEVTSSGITVNSSTHWENWTMPTHAVDLSGSTVQPHFFRARYNLLDDVATFTRTLSELNRKRGQTAILNIDSTETRDVNGNIITEKKKGVRVPVYTFLVHPGISRVGSNPDSAANILDGDPTTYWEPDPQDPIDKWWIEVDLGRTVPVDELILHFVDEELGDPFRQFKVLTSPMQRPVLQNADKIGFLVAAGTNAPNEDQRTFSFPLLEQLDAAPGWTGKMVETIRFLVTDTKGDRHTRISEPEWKALDVSERGDIVHFVKDEEGFEEPIEQEHYEDLPPEGQGRKDYYRRERPRLADIELWGFGDNLSLGMLDGGGSVSVTGASLTLPGSAFDGDYTTTFLHLIRPPAVDRGTLTVDLGATFWLDAMRVSVTDLAFAGYGTFFDGYVIRSSDGAQDARGRRKWQRLSPPEREENSVDRFNHLLDVYDPPPKVRFLEMLVVSSNPENRDPRTVRGGEIAEYELFSKGYPAEMVLQSDLIELPSARNFGRIFWEGETPPDTRLEVRTRSGDVLGKVISYYDRIGNEIKKKAWDNLLGNFKGPADTTFVPDTGWSPWSHIYKESGERVTSPGLRKFAEIQVKLITGNRDVAASIRSIDMELVNPVGRRILAEVWPTEVLAPGRVDTFEVFILTSFIESPTDSRSTGFDEILLGMSAAKSMELLALDLGFDAESGQAQQVFQPAGDVFVDQGGAQLQLLRDKADSLWVRLPHPLNILPQSEAPRVYNRIMAEGEQVPVDREGAPLSRAVYGVLEKEEKGDIRYFRQRLNASGQVQLTEVGPAKYAELEEDEKGPVRYFRILLGRGAQFPFDSKGDSLNSSSYESLPDTQKGSVSGPGQFVRLRFKAPVFRNGTTLKIDVRNTKGGTDSKAPWQSVDPGDATPLVAGNTLSIGVPIDFGVLDDVGIAPNPFTPNGDGINDVAEIGFTVFKISTGREIAVRIYALDGRRVWEVVRMVHSGQESIRWDGTDVQGQLVPPGLYLCQLELGVDSEEQGGTTRSRLISVVY